MLKDILKILEKDARSSNKQIATITGISEKQVASISVRLRKTDYIKIQNHSRLGQVENEHVFCAIEVKSCASTRCGVFDSIF
jgi:DNA-binding Lrp family transcriptional regulator